MPDTTRAGAQAAPGQQPQAGDPPSDPPNTAPQAGTDSTHQPDAGDISPADLRKMIADLRKENASHRTRLKQFEDAQAAADLAKLSDIERKDQEIATYQQQLAALQIEQQQYRLAREIARHAPSLNLIDPDAALVLLQAGGHLEYDDSGQPQNVAKLLEALIAEKPYLVASNVTRQPPPPSSGGATNPARSATQAASAQAAATAAQAARDPKEVYRQHRDRGGLSNRSIWKR